jgi:predicted transposase YbfD/YdcC
MIEHGILYYGSSRTGTPEQFANWIRGHWGIENGLHYVADLEENVKTFLSEGPESGCLF